MSVAALQIPIRKSRAQRRMGRSLPNNWRRTEQLEFFRARRGGIVVTVDQQASHTSATCTTGILAHPRVLRATSRRLRRRPAVRHRYRVATNALYT